MDAESELTWPSTKLEWQEAERYFDLDSAEGFLPLEALAPADPEMVEPDSVDWAERLMRHAATGQVPLRPPLEVTRSAAGGGYDILEGNAEYAVVLRWGWRSAPVRVRPG